MVEKESRLSENNKRGVENCLKMFKFTFFCWFLIYFMSQFDQKQLIVKKKTSKGCQLSHTKHEIWNLEESAALIFSFCQLKYWNISLFKKRKPCAHLGAYRSCSQYNLNTVCHNPNVLKILYWDGLSLTTSTV